MTDDGKLGVGVVGIGWVSHQHIGTLVTNPHTEVVGLCSGSLENAQNAKEEHGLTNAHCYNDYEQMLKQDNLDVIFICSTNEKHVDQAIAGAEAGNHLLIEKPAALSWEGLKSIAAAVDKAGVVACEGFELHWSPYFLIVHKLIRANAFGNIFYGECDYFSANWPQWYVGYPWVKTREQGGSALAAAGLPRRGRAAAVHARRGRPRGGPLGQLHEDVRLGRHRAQRDQLQRRPHRQGRLHPGGQ